MLFWMRLLKLALPAARPHRSPSSRRQHSCPAPGPPAHPPPAEPAAAAGPGPGPSPGGGGGGGGTSTAEPALPTTTAAPAGSAPRWVTSSGAKPFIPGATAAAGGIPPRTKLPRRGAAARRGAPPLSACLPSAAAPGLKSALGAGSAHALRKGLSPTSSSRRPSPATTGAAEPRGPPHFLLPPLSCGDSSAVSYVTTATCRPLRSARRACRLPRTAPREPQSLPAARPRLFPPRAPLPFPPVCRLSPPLKSPVGQPLFSPLAVPGWERVTRRVSRLGAAAGTAERGAALLPAVLQQLCPVHSFSLWCFSRSRPCSGCSFRIFYLLPSVSASSLPGSLAPFFPARSRPWERAAGFCPGAPAPPPAGGSFPRSPSAAAGSVSLDRQQTELPPLLELLLQHA